MSAAEALNRWSIQNADPAYPDVKWLRLAKPGASLASVIIPVSEDDLDELALLLERRADPVGEPRPVETLRTRLHLMVDQVLAAGAIAELDSEAMREAITDCIDIYNDQRGEAKDADPEGDGRPFYAAAAHAMYERMQRLRRYPASIPTWEEWGDGAHQGH